MNEKLCRKCLLQDAFPADYEKYVASLLKTIPTQQKTESTVYEARLNVCRDCDQLNNGTCMGCGCLVELRAAYRKETCPFKRWISQETAYAGNQMSALR